MKLIRNYHFLLKMYAIFQNRLRLLIEVKFGKTIANVYIELTKGNTIVIEIQHLKITKEG